VYHCPLDAPDQVDAGENIPPLVVPAHLQRAPPLAVQHQVVIGLEQLVVELDERQPLFQALLVRLGSQHAVNAEMDADVAQKLDIAQGQQPVGVIHGHRAALVKVKVAVHLDVDALAVFPDRLLGQHLPHLGLAAGVADHRRPAARQKDGPMPGALQVHHGHNLHQASRVQADRGAVKTNVERDLFLGQHLAHRVLVGHLGDETALNQFVVNVHANLLLQGLDKA
jgi:hypothetical protein